MDRLSCLVAAAGLALASMVYAPLAHAAQTPEGEEEVEAPAETAPTPEEPGREQPADVDLGAPPTVESPVSAPAEPAGDPDARARDHYFRAEEAYNLGDFDRAIENFEAAYSLSNRPDLLYNVSLSYFRRYDASRELPDLKRARAVLVNFELALQRDPSLGDIDQVHELMKRIDELLAERAGVKPKTDAPERPADSSPEGPIAADACPVELDASDPGRGQRVGGAVSMATGSLILAGGIASIAAFTLKGHEFENTLTGLQQDFTSEGCEGASSSRCEFLQQSIDTTINNGRQANILAATLGSGLTALGAAGVITGAIFYVQGNRRTDRWEQSRGVQISPTARGVVLRGRF